MDSILSFYAYSKRLRGRYNLSGVSQERDRTATTCGGWGFLLKSYDS
jgi:hypothetical protein